MILFFFSGNSQKHQLHLIRVNRINLGLDRLRHAHSSPSVTWNVSFERFLPSRFYFISSQKTRTEASRPRRETFPEMICSSILLQPIVFQHWDRLAQQLPNAAVLQNSCCFGAAVSRRWLDPSRVDWTGDSRTAAAHVDRGHKLVYFQNKQGNVKVNRTKCNTAVGSRLLL